LRAVGCEAGQSPPKFRSFVEILSHLIELPQPTLRFVDMGCGKGYLTFAAHEWLRQKRLAVRRK